jgi:8-oxo-dGTP diphosphatase
MSRIEGLSLSPGEDICRYFSPGKWPCRGFSDRMGVNIMDAKKSSRVYRNPVPTVDIIIEIENTEGKQGIVLIRRKNPPHGWALPGGFVDYGESLEKAAVREAAEETSLKIDLLYQLHTYSEPDRDPRRHTISTVFVAKAAGVPKAQDDARDIGIFSRDKIDFPLAFDHRNILDDYYARRGREIRTAADDRRKRRKQYDRS